MIARRTLALALGVALVAFGALGACSSGGDRLAERVVDAASGGDVDIDRTRDGGISVDTEDGRLTMGSTQIPAEWPDDVPFPPGFRPTASNSIATPEGLHLSVIGNADLTPAQADAFYADALSGWTESSRFSTSSGDGGELTSVGYEQEGRILLVGIQSGDGAELLTLTYQATETAP